MSFGFNIELRERQEAEKEAGSILIELSNQQSRRESQVRETMAIRHLLDDTPSTTNAQEIIHTNNNTYDTYSNIYTNADTSNSNKINANSNTTNNNDWADPILLLAAAAAVVDTEPIPVKSSPINFKKENPSIKRNAMHAYITYMIYTDMTHEQVRTHTRFFFFYHHLLRIVFLFSVFAVVVINEFLFIHHY
ncbi:hypothetical protein J3Q64DRAFT_1771226 [Phycomyces blakesleeanus]|uniref:Uncharacterized protein n=1 Tax=Phycomyces blakesleeanus TaxID=4837 RepID=A0ABR3ALN3_PHYBL